MSDPIDPIAITELAISKMRSEGHESEYNTARAVITSLEKAGWRIVRRETAEAHTLITSTGTYHNGAKKYGCHEDAK